MCADNSWDGRRRWKKEQASMNDAAWQDMYNIAMSTERNVQYHDCANIYRKTIGIPDTGYGFNMKEFYMLSPYFCGPRFADIGCGSGGLPLGVAYSNPEWDCYGVDVSDKMIKYCEHIANVINLKNISFIPSSIESLYIEPLDTITMYETLEHVWKVEDAFEKIVRLLKPGGRFLGTVPYKNYADGCLHFHYFTPESLINAARPYIDLHAGLMKINPHRIIFWSSNITSKIDTSILHNEDIYI